MGKLLVNIGVEVHARTLPVEKVFILSTLKKIRYYNIKHDNSTNDVGVALLSTEATRKAEKQLEI